MLNKENYSDAISAFNMAIQLSPNYDAYYGRAGAHLMIHNFEQTVNDASIALEMDPTNTRVHTARLYAYRAVALVALNNKEWVEDMKTAARLGEKRAQDILMKENIKW